jgi:alkanesulfonate monooxygenase SsuD/methylene tetrahydromethanopterin reductase-like flavin-dependent oxidoreductase (luciferase family)
VTLPILGAIFRPQFPPESLPAAIAEAESNGLAQLWLWEDCFLHGGLTTAAVALSGTRSTTVGLGLMPVPLRNVAIAAMEIATLERLFPGRLRLAVGHGVQEWMAQVGARVESPMTLMREYLGALTSLLAGARVTCDGRYVSLNDVVLDWPPLARPLILMGATGPKSLAMAGELADGVVLAGDANPNHVRHSVDLARDSRAAARITEPFDVVVYLRAYTGPSATEWMTAEEPPYAVGSGVAGGIDDIAERVLALAAAGAGTVCLVPPATETDAARYFHEVVAPVQQAIAQ